MNAELYRLFQDHLNELDYETTGYIFESNMNINTHLFKNRFWMGHFDNNNIYMIVEERRKGFINKEIRLRSRKAKQQPNINSKSQNKRRKKNAIFTISNGYNEYENLGPLQVQLDSDSQTDFQ